MTIQEALAAALQCQQAGDLRQAEELYRRILNAQPGSGQALNGLGVIALLSGRHEPASQLIRRAIAVDPSSAEYFVNLGIALAGLDRLKDAIAAFRRALELRPDYPEARANLGNGLLDSGSPAEAIVEFKLSLKLKPNDPLVLSALGGAYARLGNSLAELGEVDESIASLQQAAALIPGNWTIQNNLGIALRKIGRFNEALACFERAVALSPDSAVADSNRICAICFHPDYDSAAILREHKLWNQRHAESLRPPIVSDTFDGPDRRLRVGYVSPDFREHCQSLFTAPLLANHDRAQIEIYCYADVPRPDAVTIRLRKLADHWRPTNGMDDAALDDLIRRDKIDILVDLTMHMARGRPLLFARKPAPIQICWLAYPGTTGLSAMDARLTDPYLDPPGEHDDWYSERSMRLADTFWCYDPMGMANSADGLPEVNEPPALKSGYITFGCLNNFWKINEAVLRLWSKVLNATLRSRLLLLAPAGEARRWTVNRLESFGVTPDRVDFVSHQPRPKYLAEYQRIDIGLDTIPYNGHTTSLDSFWMGVPVVSRIGATVVGRAGWSQLSNLNLTELAAWTDEDFVTAAVRLAENPSVLAELRRTLRQRLRQSPLMDGPRFARTVEAAYRKLWNERKTVGSW